MSSPESDIPEGNGKHEKSWIEKLAAGEPVHFKLSDESSGTIRFIAQTAEFFVNNARVPITFVVWIIGEMTAPKRK